MHQTVSILKCWGNLKFGVKVDTEEFGMTESDDSVDIIRTNASTEEKRTCTCVGIEEFPLEFLTTTAIGAAWGFEKKVIDCGCVVCRTLQVFL